MDYAIARARTYGIKLIPEFQGDTRAEHAASTADHLLELARRRRLLDRPTVLGDFENHIAHIVNSYTGIPTRTTHR